MRNFRVALAADVNNPVVGDLEFDSNGSWLAVDGDRATVQELYTALRTVRGEWFLDTRIGVPWFAVLARKGSAEADLRSVVRQTVLLNPAIVDVPSVSVRVDRATRAATVDFQARTVSGTVLSSTDFPPLVIDFNGNTID